MLSSHNIDGTTPVPFKHSFTSETNILEENLEFPN